MHKNRLVFNMVFILILVSAALGNTSIVAQAKTEYLNLDPHLLQLAKAHPNFVFPIIVQKNMKNKNLPDDTPEIAVGKEQGKIHNNKKMSLIAGFSADLTGKQIANLAKNPKVRWISLDAPLFTSDFTSDPVNSSALLNVYDSAVGADKLWTEPPYLDGSGVTVAVVDSGITADPDLQASGSSSSRIIASTTVVPNSTSTDDGYGHGTHVAGILGGNGNMEAGQRIGIAPNVNLVNVKVSADNGMVLGSDLVTALQWVYDNRATYNIKVVNISSNSTVAESYNTSPIDAAVEVLWFNGVVVVVSAGNSSSGAVYPPANDPFAITVGATDDMGTASINDDAVASFSTYGITEDGFAKPELVAPGRNIISLLASTSDNIYLNHPANRVDDSYFRMSGTSMSAPMVSGAVALLLENEPSLNPDQVKYRLMATANQDWPGYSSSSAGAGYLDAYAAVQDATTGTANTGVPPSQMLSTGGNSIAWNSVGWNSVGWNSVGWNSVGWNSVGWNSVGWNSVGWNSDYWGN